MIDSKNASEVENNENMSQNPFANILNALFITNYIHGKDENIKQLLLTLTRYLCLTQIFVFRDISIQVRKRFPIVTSICNRRDIKLL
ncbi:hypothetical protein LOAG_10924 [Loa loa]|uniref:Bestrophin homolog n=1 Tax=Loa loa TaxID=7209 RepID=A0A1S0TP03_LOALO|nr:hypothetical protein LOAG_10924 [Loa loa]EFO17574.2 hypothetical protein LOAG_10924 [Loa loa]